MFLPHLAGIAGETNPALSQVRVRQDLDVILSNSSTSKGGCHATHRRYCELEIVFV
jgi:hypothetical protein